MEQKNSPFVLLIVLIIAVGIISFLVIMFLSESATEKKLEQLNSEWNAKLETLNYDTDIQEIKDLIKSMPTSNMTAFEKEKIMNWIKKFDKELDKFGDKLHNLKSTTTIIYTPSPPY